MTLFPIPTPISKQSRRRRPALYEAVLAMAGALVAPETAEPPAIEQPIPLAI